MHFFPSLPPALLLQQHSAGMAPWSWISCSSLNVAAICRDQRPYIPYNSFNSWPKADTCAVKLSRAAEGILCLFAHLH